MGIAEDIIIIILVGLLTGFIAHKMKLPLLLGYIAGGIIIGPYTGGISVTNIHEIELLAEIGVALLLFSIGLDISFKEIKDVRRIALIGTPLQLFFTVAYGYIIGWFLGFPWETSIVFGAIISLSSTMIVFKTLMSRGLMGTLSSKVMIGVLIVQDLAAVPMMIIVPRLNNMSQSFTIFGITLLKGLIILTLVIVAGTRLIPYALKYISKLNSRELFLLTVMALGLGIGFLTYYVGLSFALGAFVTGMVLNKSDYSHKALTDIIPLRDIFGLVFFTSVGMLIDVDFLLNNISIILIMVTLILVGKSLIFFILSRAFGYYNVIPIAVGLGLSQVGEFSFVIARLGLAEKLLSHEHYSIILTASVMTMLISPFLSMLTSPLYGLRNRFFRKERMVTTNFPGGGFSDHVVIAGGGRIGGTIAATLHQLGVPFVMIEMDHARFELSKRKGYPIIYGDACQETTLDAARLSKARLLLVTIPAMMVAREIINIVMRYNPGIKIVARGNSLDDVNELYAMHVNDVVQPEFEAGLEIIRQALLHLDMPVSAIQKYIDESRRLQYPQLSIENMKLLTDLKKASCLLEMGWYPIFAGSPAVGKSLRELNIREKTGVSVVGVYRGDAFHANPDAKLKLLPDDNVAVIGSSDSRKIFEELVRPQ